ncbi:aminopeptidase Ey-like [Daphnia pulex]|uniref:aminopeptidase Ey-like n=1 Tax=Daphnia pulex TaxID=6669 RepID=UPI001EDFBCD5|nr:aminopeptidase Ey-like [Daphnia pulex]XP_046441610.1 aminopeptidase Ey-like [Daphnia pulex]XP_046441611.1 aminopeptidase Ey-like [Daphnia pulex]
MQPWDFLFKRDCVISFVIFLLIFFQNWGTALTADEGDMRLPKNFLPISYDIKLIPIIEEGNFTTIGYIEILVDCLETTSNISMNSADITINQPSILVTNLFSQDIVEVAGLILEPDRQIVTIQLATQILSGQQYKISMNFVAVLNNELRGFYRSTYEEEGVTKYLAVTQFSAPDARRSFPCFDEPNMKAEFTITLGRKKTMSSNSNMPRIKTEPMQDMEDYVWDFYQTTVKMSSYLVGMMVSEFAGTPSESELSRVPFTIWTRPSLTKLTKYAGNIGPQIMKYLEYYTQIDYPLPKVDMAAIPDFAAGAMENWGHINFKEADLLIDEQRSSEVAKQRVAEVTGHELAHFWFGNLVTHDFWNLVWLKEGFSRYFQYIGADSVEPGFLMNEQFGVATLQSVFRVDSLESSRPLDFGVNNSASLNTLFDVVVYDKGASIVRMMANFLGHESFRHSMTRYLHSRAYGNAVQDDLWQAIQEQADIDGLTLPATVKAIMDPWTIKMGYPLITVARNYGGSVGGKITQGRFLLRKSANSTEDTTVYRWFVPLTFTNDFTLPHRSIWISDTEDSMSVANLFAADDQWVVFNVGQVGYYRVSYDDTNYGLILKQLSEDYTAIPPKNRAQLLDDTLTIARANIVSYEKAMDLTKYLALERDYAPWTAAANALDFIDIMLYGFADFNEWKDYMSGLVIPLYQYVGFDEGAQDTHLFVYTRTHAIHWACFKLDNADCVQHADDVYSSWMSSIITENDISPNLLRLISCTAISNGGDPEWNFGYQKYLASTLANEKLELLKAMTCAKDPDIIYHMLELMIDDTSGIRLQDANTLFSSIASNPIGHGVALDFLITRWDEVNSYFSGYVGFGGGSSMPGLFRSLCDRVNTNEQLTKLIKLRDDHFDVLGSSKSVKQGVELAQSNVLWVEQHYSEVITWLKKQKITSSSAAINPNYLAMTVLALIGGATFFRI